MKQLFWKKHSKKRNWKLNSFRNTKQHNIFANWNPYSRGLTFHNLLIFQYIKKNLKNFILFKKKINNLNLGNPPGIKLNSKYFVSIDDCLSFEEMLFLNKSLNKNFIAKEKIILEIGAGYGRTAEMIINHFHVKTYFIIDYGNILKLTKKYLKTVLNKRKFNKIIFIDFEKFNFQKNFFKIKKIDLVINIDSFHEIEIKIIKKYLNYFKNISKGFYIKNAVNKYKPRDMIHHEDTSRPPKYNLKLGMNKKTINIFDAKELELSRKKYIKNYNPFKKKFRVKTQFSDIYNFYLHCIFIKKN